jgi:hypothetical protein
MIEVAIQCDEPLEEGIEALGVIMEALGLEGTDAELVVGSSEDGEPVLVAVLSKLNHEESE